MSEEKLTGAEINREELAAVYLLCRAVRVYLISTSSHFRATAARLNNLAKRAAFRFKQQITAIDFEKLAPPNWTETLGLTGESIKRDE